MLFLKLNRGKLHDDKQKYNVISMDHIHPFPTRWRHGTNGGYEDVCFPINACNQCNQMAISLPTWCP